MHRSMHEKPPIPWTSISMSKKREAVQRQVGLLLYPPCTRMHEKVAELQ